MPLRRLLRGRSARWILQILVSVGIVVYILVDVDRVHLVERLAEELAGICLAADPRIAEVEIAVEKPGALRYARSVGVVIRRRREGESG